MKYAAIYAYFFLLTAIPFSLSCMRQSSESTSSDKQATQKAEQLKILKYYRTSTLKSLDPMKQFDSASSDIIKNVYDTLLQYHYLARPYELVPGLLAKMPEKGADGLTYTLTLREGVKFIDDECFSGGKGREVKADDVIYSIKRFSDSNVNVLSYTLIKGFVEGLDEFRDATKELGKKTDYSKLDIAGVKKIGSHQLSIKFTSGNPLAFYPLAFSGLSIVPKEAVDYYGDAFEQHPVGTGPFFVKEYSRRGTLILAKNPNYFEGYPDTEIINSQSKEGVTDAKKKLPLIDEVHLPLIEERQPAMLKFLLGELDWVTMNPDDFPKLAYRDQDGSFHLKPEYAAKYEMYAEPALSTTYISFNMNDPLLGKNRALRQAIGYAMNVQKWINLLRNGRGTPLKTIVPHSIAGSEHYFTFEYYTQNVEVAKRKLSEAGFPDGKGLPELTMDLRSTDEVARRDFEFMRNELTAVGIRIKGNFQTFSNFLKRVDAGNYQIAEAGWIADYPDAENFYQLLYCPNKVPGPNHGSYCNPEYDKLYESAKFMTNGPARFEIFKKMSEIVREDAPVIIRYSHLSFGLYNRRLSNMKRNMMINAPFKYLSIENDLAKVAHK